MFIEDLYLYKDKAAMSKEYATYFAPFSSINLYDKNMLDKEPQTKMNVLNVKEIMQNLDISKILKLKK